MKDPLSSLTTDRLLLRRFNLDDLALLARLHSDPEVMRYVGGTKTRAQTEALFQTRILDYYEQYPGLGMWATVERKSGACVGTHLLNHIHGETYIQVGYLLFSQYWGLGYATEMSIAILRYGFSVLGLPEIFAITDLPNVASQRVLEKAGLERKGERSFAHPAYSSGPLAWFEGKAAPWLAAHPE